MSSFSQLEHPEGDDVWGALDAAVGVPAAKQSVSCLAGTIASPRKSMACSDRHGVGQKASGSTCEHYDLLVQGCHNRLYEQSQSQSASPSSCFSNPSASIQDLPSVPRKGMMSVFLLRDYACNR